MHVPSFGRVNAVEMWRLVETEHLQVFLQHQVLLECSFSSQLTLPRASALACAPHLVEVGQFGGPRSWASVLGIVADTKRWVLGKKRHCAKL